MKTIVERLTSLSKFIVDDDATIIMNEDNIELPNMVIYGLNKYSVLIFENVIPPSDWVGNKYLYDNSQWILNPDWAISSDEVKVLSLEERKNELYDELSKLRTDLAILITECKLVNNPEPPELITLIDLARNMYSYAKSEIDALTLDNYESYILKGEQVNQLIDELKAFL